MSARVLFCCWPFEGHVFPQLSIALALRDRGAEVAFYTGRRLEETISGQGIQVFPHERIESAWEAVRDYERAVGGRRQSVRVAHRAFRQWLVETIPSQVADLREVRAAFGPDVLVTDASMWGPSLVLRETERIPVALATPLMFALVPGPDAPPAGTLLRPATSPGGRLLASAIKGATDLAATGLRRRVDEIRASFGLPSMGCGVNAYLGGLDLYLVFSTPELDFNRWDLPPSVHYVGPCLWYPPQEREADALLETVRDDRPWVLITVGTSHLQDPFVLRAAVQGLSGTHMEVIITHGRGRPREEFAPDPVAPNIHVFEWVNYDELLPRCAAMVTSGGAGTLIAGLRAGIPIVIVPTTWEKPDHAVRVADAGAAVILRPRRCSPEHLRKAVEEILGAPTYREAAQRAAASLAASPGPAGAAELIEGLATPTAQSSQTTTA
jgi:MGT family glycosyltransferase